MMDVDNVLAPSFMDSDDSEDAVNSSSAKVYFGPILSPEKKLVLKLNQHRSIDIRDQLASHSSRPFSSVLRTPPLLKQDQATCDSYGDPTPSTPIQSKKDKQISSLFAEGEPSSILASRILRAHDNPSPPPKSHGLNTHSSPDIFPLSILHELQKQTVKPGTSEAEFESVITHKDDSVSELLSKSPLTLCQPSPSEEDLISFDRSLLVVPADDQAKYEICDQGETVEDPLSSSPILHVLSPQIPNVPFLDLKTDLSTPPRRRSSRLSTSHTQSKEILSPEVKSPSSLSSMRRKRKREDGDGVLVTSQEEFSKASISRLSLSPNRVSLSDLEMLDIGDDDYAKRKAIRKEKKRLKLDRISQEIPIIQSLSPSSSNLLSSLVTSAPTTQSCGLSEKTQGKIDSPKSSSILRPDWNFSRNNLSSPQRPPLGTPYFASKLVPQTPQLNSFASPLKFGFGLNDPNRTPARRVPVAESAVVSRNTKNSQLTAATFKLATHSAIFAKNRFDRSPSNRTPVSIPAIADIASPFKFQNRLGIRIGSHSIRSDNKSEGSSKIVDTDQSDSFATSTSPGSTHQAFVKGLDIPHKPAMNVFDSRIPRGTFSFRASTNATRSSGENTSKLPMHLIRTLSIASNKGTRSFINNEDENIRKLSSGPKNTVQIAQRKHSFKSSPSRRSPIGGRKIPGAFSNSDKSFGIAKTTSSGTHHRVSPSKKLGTPVKPIIPRAVIKGTLQDFEIRSACFGGLQALSDARAREKEREDLKEQQKAKEIDDMLYNVDVYMEDATTIAEEQDPFQSSQVLEFTEIDHNVSREVSSPSLKSSSQRTPKVTGKDSDTLTGYPSVSRRRGDSIFNHVLDSKPSLPMNALALKTLTNSNTTKNQQYHSELKIQIIRKPGSRPTSPTTKLRTISQKQREEQGKQRAERAKRRRGEDAMGDIDDSDFNVDGISNGCLKHPRAPGDDEDYVTPQRPIMDCKRVKWDIGLTTAKYLNEIEPRLQGRHRDIDLLQSSRKSCLVKKKMIIDSFGNNVDTDIALNISREQITVAKFVYDNDEDNGNEESEDHVKVTKSKTKRTRSV